MPPSLAAPAAVQTEDLEQRLWALTRFSWRGHAGVRSLEPVRRALRRLGNPHHRLGPVVHVAGTNGKGSTLAFLRAILTAAGVPSLLYTSPHLVDVRERFQDQSGPLSDERLVAALDRLAPVAAEVPLNYFQVATLAAILAFAAHDSSQPAPLVLWETGVGGRLDTTNVVPRKALTLMTSIGLDHQATLGHSPAAIALEKAGILRPAVPVILAPQRYPEVCDIIRGIAKRLKAPLIEAEATLIPPIQRLGLTGPHQRENAATAVMAVRCLAPWLPAPISPEIISQGLERAGWPGRLQPLASPNGPAQEWWVDGAHNGDAAARVAEAIALWPAQPLSLIVAMANTRDPADVLTPFAALKPYVVAIPLPDGRGGVEANTLTPESIVNAARALGLTAEQRPSLASAAQSVAPKLGRVLLIGSLYLAGHALSALDVVSPQ